MTYDLFTIDERPGEAAGACFLTDLTPDELRARLADLVAGGGSVVCDFQPSDAPKPEPLPHDVAMGMRLIEASHGMSGEALSVIREAADYLIRRPSQIRLE